MKFVSAALLLGVVLTLPALADDPAPPSDGGFAAKLQPFVDSGVLPGGVIEIASKDKVLDVETFGYMDYDKKIPMRPDALFMICSMTKTFTAAGLMMLVDEGKISLDDPVEKYLPAFKGQMVDDPKNPGHPHPPSHPITIRECMSHTAGLTHKAKIPCTDAVDAANEIAKYPLEWDPGTNYHYSTGPVIGGAIIQVVSGMKYVDFLQQRLFAPLGLKDTTFFPDEKLAERYVITGQFNAATNQLADHDANEQIKNSPDKWSPVPWKIINQANGDTVVGYKSHYGRPDSMLYSTAADCTRFCQMLLNNGTLDGKQYLTPEAVKEMDTVQSKNYFPGHAEGYGIGTFVQRWPTPTGPSVGSFGHRGARKTVMWVDPHAQLVIVFMTAKWDLKKEEQEAIDRAIYQPAVAKYGQPLPGEATVAVH